MSEFNSSDKSETVENYGLVEERYGLLVVIERTVMSVLETGRNGRKVTRNRVACLCRCDCGNEKVVHEWRMKRGEIKSCGCYSKSRMGKESKKHGQTKTVAYSIHQHIIRRCLNKACKAFPQYGGRGITVCDRWLGPDGFTNFLADMGEPPVGASIDRFPNNDGNYEPGNCRWATRKQQNRNKRSNLMINFRGELKCLSEWCEELGLGFRKTHDRIMKLGWNLEDAFTQGKRKRAAQ